MRKLFLASYFALVSDLLLPLLPKKPSELTIAFIPTAADPYKIKLWYYGDKLKLKLMGFRMIDIDIKNQTKEQLTEKMKNVDAIFVCGGNTYYLLKYAQKSGFDEVVRELVAKGVIYIGSSAGSVLACPTIEYIEDLDDKEKVNVDSYKGIGLVDFLILPHYEDPKYAGFHQTILKKWGNNKYRIQTLSNDQVIIVDNNNIKVFSA